MKIIIQMKLTLKTTSLINNLNKVFVVAKKCVTKDRPAH